MRVMSMLFLLHSLQLGNRHDVRIKKTQSVINLARNFYTFSTTDLPRAEFRFAFIFRTLESPPRGAVSITP
jgi:hypothetical protein